jgi:hypothetical protein
MNKWLLESSILWCRCYLNLYHSRIWWRKSNIRDYNIWLSSLCHNLILIWFMLSWNNILRYFLESWLVTRPKVSVSTSHLIWMYWLSWGWALLRCLIWISLFRLISFRHVCCSLIYSCARLCLVILNSRRGLCWELFLVIRGWDILLSCRTMSHIWLRILRLIVIGDNWSHMIIHRVRSEHTSWWSDPQKWMLLKWKEVLRTS